jgi:YegS/Rv2252/BmrU family lipid kinase
MKSNWVFIVNPIAGNGYAGKYVDDVRQILQKHHQDVEIVLTEKKGHATSLARDYVARGFDHILAIGGDGTFNEVVQSLVQQPQVVFGAIAAGTGNDFIHILGFPDRFTPRDWEILFEENTVQMDIGQCNDRYFLNGMGLGFDAQVALENYHAENSRSVKTGAKSKYWRHILKTLVFYREKDMRVTLAGQTQSTKSFLNTIAIGRRMAGGFYLTPRAIANDGLLDICLIQELSLPGRVKELLRVLKQSHLEDEVVHYYQSDQILFEFDTEVPAHLDGELYFNSRFAVNILPAHLKIIYNPYGAHYFKV